MRKIAFVLFLLAAVLTASCDIGGGKNIPVTLTGPGTYLVNDIVHLHAEATYNGSGTLSYDWTVGSSADPDHDADSYWKATAANTWQVKVVVTDGKMTGVATGTVIWQ